MAVDWSDPRSNNRVYTLLKGHQDQTFYGRCFVIQVREVSVNAQFP